MSLVGKVALITGGTKNLGRLTAIELASKHKANLFLHYNSTQGDEKKLANELSSKYNVKVELYQGNLGSARNVEKLFEAAKAKFGSIDIAINNVGKVLKKPMVEVTEEEFDEMDLVNNKIAFFFIAQATKHVSSGGSIISLVTSLLAAYTPFYAVYQGTKSAVEFYTKSASKELIGKRVSVNCIAPGPMDTPFFYAQEQPEAVEFYKSVSFDNRLTKIEDIAPIVGFLATSGSWMTGQTLYASGGMTAR
ncbi:KLTH0A08008p [Lachancea thermotolerans CBS 6340]|uniref:KLTH0A08008p n=1 Tax=Lachancea thermotolerans (strain ATCC 56472 / CBS 6340 / NRRL Y-8284) TaxID=559295 RepID=C5DC53_LACTC|nr:KLTH0A08008p [Lachancea thermotolerans CBS 6340]CAR21361.1 KLTH0A08008p [Lachancea thermotolerans CBS 6340]